MLDPSILLGGRPSEPMDLAGAFAQGTNIKNARQQNELGKVQLDTVRKAQADEQLLNSLFTKHTTKDEKGASKVDDDAVLTDLFSMGKGDLARKYQAQKVERETADATHATALANNELKALELEHGRTTELSALARSAMTIKDLPDPVKSTAWEMFTKKATEIDPDLKDHIPSAFDESFLQRGIEAGLTEEESLKRRIAGATATADQNFKAAIPAIEKQITAAGKDGQKLAAIQRDLVLQYPGSKLAEDYAKAFPKGVDGDAGAIRRELAADREKARLEDQALRQADKYQARNDKNLAAAVQLKDVDQILERIGIAGGIYGNPDQVNIPGYGVGAAGFRKFLQSEDAVDLKAAVSGLYNSYRNQLFGSALTQTEKDAFEDFVGTGTFANQKAFVSGLRKLNGVLDQALRPVGTPRTTEILKESGILTHDDLPSKTKAAERMKPGASSGNPIKVKTEAEALNPKNVGKYVTLNGQVFMVQKDGN